MMKNMAARIGENLTRWMDASKTLTTLKVVASKSGVGYGTVRRARNGEGNLTIDNIEKLSAAFGKTAYDLIAYDPDDDEKLQRHTELLAEIRAALKKRGSLPPEIQSAILALIGTAPALTDITNQIINAKDLAETPERAARRTTIAKNPQLDDIKE